MKYAISTFWRARADIDQIYAWIAERSPEGAARWNEALEHAIDQLRSGADTFSAAPESANLGGEVRQILFKTRRGGHYRVIYTLAGSVVRLLRVRGPGQSQITADDIAE